GGRARLAGRGAHLLPRPLAQEATPQAAAAPAALRGPAVPAPAPGRPAAPGHRLATLCRAHVGRTRCRTPPAQPGRPRRRRPAPGMAPPDPLRSPRPEARPRRLGPAVRPHLGEPHPPWRLAWP